MEIDEAIRIVLMLAESKWIKRVWRLHRLTRREIEAIRVVSQHVEHGHIGNRIKERSE